MVTVPFLDVQVQLDSNGFIKTDLYCKETAKCQYLLPTSCHAGHVTTNIPFSLGYRLLRICSEREDFLSRLEQLRQNLFARNYPAKVVHNAFERVKAIPRSEALKRVERKKTDREALVITYHPSLPSAAQVIRKHWQVMVDQCPSLKRCFKQPSVVAYRRSKNIGDMLIRAKVKTTRKSKRLSKGYSVCKPVCMACPFSGLKPSEKVTSHKCKKSGQSWDITSALDCQTKNVVYRITCKKPRCQFVYIGETSQKFCQRLTAHRGNISRKENTAVANHFNSKGHSIEDLQAIAIEKVLPTNNDELRQKRESLWISR